MALLHSYSQASHYCWEADVNFSLLRSCSVVPSCYSRDMQRYCAGSFNIIILRLMNIFSLRRVTNPLKPSTQNHSQRRVLQSQKRRRKPVGCAPSPVCYLYNEHLVTMNLYHRQPGMLCLLHRAAVGLMVDQKLRSGKPSRMEVQPLGVAVKGK